MGQFYNGLLAKLLAILDSFSVVNYYKWSYEGGGWKVVGSYWYKATGFLVHKTEHSWMISPMASLTPQKVPKSMAWTSCMARWLLV